MKTEINITLAAAEIVRRWDELARDGVINREASIAGILEQAKEDRINKIHRISEPLEKLIEAAAENLPELWEVRIVVQRGYGEVTAIRPDGSEVPMGDGESTITEQFRNVSTLIRDEMEHDKILNNSVNSV